MKAKDTKQFEWGKRTYLMGILNVTPDSFSGDGVMDPLEATERGKEMESEGADIIDVGGESTRPGAAPVTLEEELARVIPVIQELSKRVTVPISIDTYKAEVAQRAIDAGALMINDVWAGRMDAGILKVAATTGAYIVLMHNRSNASEARMKKKLGGRYEGVEYKNLIVDIKKELQDAVGEALKAGVRKERIIIDPGLGFGKTTEQSLQLIARLDEMASLSYPILVGPSRKSFVGYTLDLPPGERLEGTAAAVALSIANGADVVRVHDVGAMRRVASFTDAVERGKW